MNVGNAQRKYAFPAPNRHFPGENRARRMARLALLGRNSSVFLDYATRQFGSLMLPSPQASATPPEATTISVAFPKTQWAELRARSTPNGASSTPERVHLSPVSRDVDAARDPDVRLAFSDRRGGSRFFRIRHSFREQTYVCMRRGGG